MNENNKIKENDQFKINPTNEDDRANIQDKGVILYLSPPWQCSVSPVGDSWQHRHDGRFGEYKQMKASLGEK